MRTTTGRMTLCVLLFTLAACVAASSGRASPSIQYGIQDDAWLEFGSGTLNQRLATLKRLGVPPRLHGSSNLVTPAGFIAQPTT